MQTRKHDAQRDDQRPHAYGKRQGALLGAWLASVRRERDRALAEVLEIRGLMPLLMKRRNGKPWTRAERTELRMILRRVSSLSPYLVILAVPGSIVLLPLFTWWLDRRRQRQKLRRSVRNRSAS